MLNNNLVDTDFPIQLRRNRWTPENPSSTYPSFVTPLCQESLDLINEIRSRAGLDAVEVRDFSGTEDLRTYILRERSWEFYSEGLRQEDLIRYGLFIDFAINRGVSNAQPSHNRYPLPLGAIDSNPELVQNQAY